MMQWTGGLLAALIILYQGQGVAGAMAAHVSSLHKDLFANYNPLIRPVRNQSETLSVQIAFRIEKINQLDEMMQVFTVTAWLELVWVDEFMIWDKEDYGGVKWIIVKQKDLWKPDLILVNAASSGGYLGDDNMLVTVTENGTVFWVYWAVFDATCAISIVYYPFDVQTCNLNFTSVIYDTNQITYTLINKKIYIVEYALNNGEWKIIDTEAEASSYYLPESEAFFSWNRFTVKLRRKTTFYILNMVFPVVLYSLLNSVVFLVPVDSGDKISLAVTLLLSFTVLLTMINAHLPMSSDGVSLMTVYVALLMGMSTIAVLVSVIVVKLHFKAQDRPLSSTLHRCVRSILGRKTTSNKKKCTKTNQTGPMREGHDDHVSPGMIGQNQNSEDVSTTASFQDVARALDILFFWIYILMAVITGSICLIILNL